MPKYLQAQVAVLQKQHKAITIRNAMNLSSAALIGGEKPIKCLKSRQIVHRLSRFHLKN